MNTFSRRIIFFLVLLTFSPLLSQAQTALDVFGKNRVQHKDFEWKAIYTTNFEVYYYQEGNEIAYFAARHAEADFDRIADLLGYTPYSKTKIFLYNSITDLQQSNVGLNSDVVLVGGQTNFVKSRVEIPYTGDAVAFKKELSLGIAQMFITEMMFGGSIKDMVQSSYLLSLPDWFVAGAAAYVAEGWGADMDDFMRDVVVHKNVRRPSVLTGDEARLIGQSIWNYIAERYGKANISNILNLTRIIRNEESSISSTLGVYPYSNFLREWRNFYASTNAPILSNYTMPREDVRVRKNTNNRFLYNQVKISPNGEWLAYSEGFRGRYEVYAKNLKTGRRKSIMAGGYRAIGQRFDPTIPLVSWRNRNQLVVIHVAQGEYTVSVYDITKNFFRKLASRKPLKNFMQVKDFDVSEDGKTLVMSAVRNGKNDLFLYEISRGAVTQLTDDLYDDLNPHFVAGAERTIVFSSNRLSDSLKADKGSYQSINNKFDLFEFETSSPTAKRIVNTPGNETQPLVRDGRIYFLNDLTGVQQLYRYDRSSGTTHQVTNFRQNLHTYDVRSQDNSLAYSILDDRRQFVGLHKNFDLDAPKPLFQTKRSEILIDRIDPAQANLSVGSSATSTQTPTDTQKVPTPPKDDRLVLEPGEVDTDNYEFDKDVKKAAGAGDEPQRGNNNIAATVGEANNRRQQNVQIQGPVKYQNRFSTDNTVTSFVIDPLRKPNGLGITFDIEMNEMLENHKIRGGFTGFFDLASSNFYGEYQYLKKRIDVGVRYDKRTYLFTPTNATNEFSHRYNLHKIQLPISYPLDVSNRIVVSPILALTRFVQSEFNTGSAPPVAITGYGGIKAEYVFDNTTINGLNMTEGTRIRIRYENYVGLIDRDSIVDPAAKSFHNFNVDVRHYQKVHRDIILAIRMAYGRFGGRAPKNYLLGGMDNWAFNERDARSQNDPLLIQQGRDNRDILFTELATNMRGFPINKLSGNSFLLLNAELRLPLVKYFYRGPITSNFFKNLQFVGFTDIGTAWSGESPFSRNNSLNTTVVTNGPFRAVVTNFKNPFLVGYGAGARTLLFGYYVKFDVAWGVEDFVVNPQPRYYLTLGYDF